MAEYDAVVVEKYNLEAPAAAGKLVKRTVKEPGANEVSTDAVVLAVKSRLQCNNRTVRCYTTRTATLITSGRIMSVISDCCEGISRVLPAVQEPSAR